MGYGENIRDTILHLHLTQGVSLGVIELLHTIWGQQLDIIYSLTVSDIQAAGVPREQAELVVHGLKDRRSIDQTLLLADKHHIDIIARWQPSYPALLHATHKPPPILFVQGSLPSSSRLHLAIVGSREADSYARMVTQEVVAALPEGTCVVSGGALGADTYAHEAALQAGLPTVAVLGSGLLVPYPRRNISLFHTIAQRGGAVVSSFPLDAQPLKSHFPARNRIIAGLAQGTLVVQAAAKSGALVTAAYALQEGRDVGAVPGNIGHPLSEGCNRLIQQGAFILGGAPWIREFLGCKEAISKAPVPRSTDLQTAVLVDPLINFCAVPRDVDELAREANMDYVTLFAKLQQLELDGLIEQTLTGQWLARR